MLAGGGLGVTATTREEGGGDGANGVRVGEGGRDGGWKYASFFILILLYAYVQKDKRLLKKIRV